MRSEDTSHVVVENETSQYVDRNVYLEYEARREGEMWNEVGDRSGKAGAAFIST